MENLCTDILENILFRLPVDTALQAKRVRTTWRAVLRNKTEKTGFLFARSIVGEYAYRDIKQLFYEEDEYVHYAQSKLMNYYSDNNRFTTETEHSIFITECVPSNVMVGSCNGLVCFGKLYVDALKPFLVCNPFTGESICPEFNNSDLPQDVSSGPVPNGRLASGFGYCPSTNDYKLVTVVYCKEEQKGGHVQVYTVGTGEWRYIGFNDRWIFNYTSGIYANGALFWVHRTNDYRVQESEIVAFDLEGEKFHYLALPSSTDFEYVTCNSPLKLLEGDNNLYLVHTNYGASTADIWLYKTCYAVKECDGEQNYHWLKEFSFQLDFPSCFKPFAITRSNAVLWYDWIGKSLYLYDPKTSTLNKLRDGMANGAECSVHIEAIPHTRSTVSLEDLGETNVTSLRDLKKKLKLPRSIWYKRPSLRRSIFNHQKRV